METGRSFSVDYPVWVNISVISNFQHFPVGDSFEMYFHKITKTKARDMLDFNMVTDNSGFRGFLRERFLYI
jgi:hypothetical protein